MDEKDTQEVTESKTSSQGSSLGTPIAIVIAGVIVAGAIIFSGGGAGTPTIGGNNPSAPAQPEGPSQEELLALAAITDDDHVRGNRDAEVYILEFSDTECPFCKRFHGTMKEVIEEYNGEVAWVYRHFPLEQLHPTAPREAEATECAAELGGADMFWTYTDQIYEQTPDREALTDADLSRIASEVGLNVGAFESCLNSGKYTDLVNAEIQNAIDLGGRGTPHSLIVTKDQVIPIQGAQPFSVVKASLDAVINN